MELTGRRAIVTGASSGIGEELGLQLGAKRCKVALSARRKDRLEETATRVRAAGGEALVVEADVAREADCKRLVEEAVKAFGGLDLLVCNAGTSMTARFDEVTDLSLFERLMAVNYLGAVYCTGYALPHLKKSRGTIAVVSSLFGKLVAPTRTGYAATKHALHGFYDCLRLELADSGVQVTLVCPALVATEIRQVAATGSGTPSGREPHDARKIMSAAECARQSLRAIEQGKNELLMTASGKFGVKMRTFFPGLVDAMVARRVVR